MVNILYCSDGMAGRKGINKGRWMLIVVAFSLLGYEHTAEAGIHGYGACSSWSVHRFLSVLTWTETKWRAVSLYASSCCYLC